ncbi:DEAD/DEAH box helicase [Pseudalkalibacillus berkeleyi]|uniref:DEAD/DEAH box helicase n=1 Tax=Pseudalkalibacillus berkeleyi TaxID=1069813 RepID=A0ABS9GZW6_9BACL|nr:DEAD/DEAH box helicase [Pseudalkalibacillus berkeleyi]MCF6137306.1 DEAD/DEAH box helicase [Pseudalkalibacillus berkeleyi]
MLTYYHLQMTFIPSLDERGKFLIWVTKPSGEPISIQPSRLHWLLGESNLSHVFTSENEATKTLMVDWDEEHYEVEGVLVDMWRVYLFLQNPTAHSMVGSFYFGESFVYWETVARSIKSLIRAGQYFPTIYEISKEKRHYAYAQWMISRHSIEQRTMSDWLKSASPLIFSFEHLSTFPIREWQNLMLDIWADQVIKVHITSGPEIGLDGITEEHSEVMISWERALTNANASFFQIFEKKSDIQKLHVLIREVRKWHEPISTDRYRSLEKGLVNFKQQFIQTGFSVQGLNINCFPTNDEEMRSWGLQISVEGEYEESLLQLPIDDSRITRSHIKNWVDDRINYLVQMDDTLYQSQRMLRQSGSIEISLDTLRSLHENMSVLKSMNIHLTFPEGLSLQSFDREDVQVSLKVNNDHGDGVGLSSLLNFNWKIAIGDIEMSVEEFKRLVYRRQYIIQKDDAWVMLPQDKIEEIFHEMNELEPIVRSRASFSTLVGVSAKNKDFQSEIDLDIDREVKDYLDHFLSPTEEQYHVPDNFQGELRPYQKKGYQWMRSHRDKRIGVCLADDMGLGKTIQAITYLLDVEKQATPHLIICPTSVLGNWKQEVKRFAPSLNVHLHHGAERSKDIDEFQNTIKDKDVVITSYALLLRDSQLFAELNWNAVILDEAQMIKNPSTKQSRLVRSLSSIHRIALTGTPMENRLEELWSISDFLNPGYLGNRSTFNQQFIRPIEKKGQKERVEVLKRLIQPFLLRRSKQQTSIVEELPEKTEAKIHCQLTKEQASLYQMVVDQIREKLQSTTGMERRGTILGGITKLKQVCNHPSLLTWDEPVASQSGKIAKFLEILDTNMKDGEKALVFTQYVKMGDLLKNLMEKESKDTTVFFLHGGIPSQKREQMLKKFRDTQSKRCIFILSIKAGGVGLNLTEANHVIHMDRWWNPAVENQATDRAFRIGQEQNVSVYKMITVGTLEEGIDKLIDRKSKLTSQIVSHDDQWVTEMSDKELIDLIQLREKVLYS